MTCPVCDIVPTETTTRSCLLSSPLGLSRVGTKDRFSSPNLYTSAWLRTAPMSATNSRLLALSFPFPFLFSSFSPSPDCPIVRSAFCPHLLLAACRVLSSPLVRLQHTLHVTTLLLPLSLLSSRSGRLWCISRTQGCASRSSRTTCSPPVGTSSTTLTSRTTRGRTTRRL